MQHTVIFFMGFLTGCLAVWLVIVWVRGVAEAEEGMLNDEHSTREKMDD